MNISAVKSGDILTVELDGRLDAMTTSSLDGKLDLEGVRELVLDFAQCDYVSSAGIRTILKAHQRMAKAHGKMVVKNVSRRVRELFELTGLSEIITIGKKTREISHEGLELLSAGVCGECFRLDGETVVKLYHEGVEPHIAEREKQYAKAAFVMGIPTAISYDVVSCGTRSGIVFELLDAELFSAVIRRDLGNLDHHAKMLSDTAKTLHAAKGDKSILPDLKQLFRVYIREIGYLLTPEQSEFLMEKLESLPDADNCVHFDLHSSNIMVQNGELVIIDMGDFSTGSYLFDIGLIYMIYGVPELGISMLATKIPTKQGLQFWNHFEKHYFAGKSAEERAFFQENKYFLASLRTIYCITFLTHLRSELERWLKDILLPKMMETRRMA
ncbi:MAG: anti-sigma factor antagonist [Chthoniobacterales bacterium]